MIAEYRLPLYLIAGLLLGILYFHGLWWNVRLFTRTGQMRNALAVMVGRIVLLGGVLTLAGLRGAWPLLTTALGILLARLIVVQRVRAAML